MLLFLCLMLSGGMTFETKITLETPPEADDLYLTNVVHVEIDDKGYYYASNFPSAQVFVWNPDGSFRETFGRKGEGPGEFTFNASLGPPMGHIYQVKDSFYIYDGGNRTVSILDRDYRFRKRVNLDGLGGKINGFHVLEPGRLLFYDSYFCKEKACRRIMVYNEDGKLLETWREADDNTWARDESAGVVNLYIWEPIPVMDFSTVTGEAVLAHSKAPVLDIVAPDGNVKRQIKLQIPKRAVSKDDIEEYNSQEWVKGNKFVKIIFPEEKDYFDRVLTLKDGYLVFHMSPLYAIAEGYMVDKQGKVMDRFRFECGEGGGLYAPRGRLVGAIVDEEGDFHLKELVIKR